MKADPEVEKWFSGKPGESTLRRVREVVLGADRRLSEHLKYGTVIFASGGDFASFVQHDKKTVSLMFNRGARIPGKFAHLEGTGPTARFMRFANSAEVDARAKELAKIAVAWCDLMAEPKASKRK